MPHVERQEEEKKQRYQGPGVKLLGLQWLWLTLLIAPIYAGDWWDVHFNFWQSATSLALIVAIAWCYWGQRLYWYAKSFTCVCLLQICLNTYDTLLGVPVNAYNATQGVLNGLEFVLLFGVGTLTELRGWCESIADNHRANRRRPDNG